MNEMDRLAAEELERITGMQITNRATCRGCGAAIWWAITRKDRRMPLDRNGRPHWETCPNAGEFRRRRR